jgi:Tfp pilus assembly protein PilO
MKMTPRDRVLLGVLVVLLACGGFYKFLLTPERHRANALQTKITAAQASLAKAQQRELTGHAAEIALGKDKSDWTAAQRAVPNNANIPALLKLLARSANAANVTMQSIALSGSSTSSAALTTTAATGAAGPVSVPVSLTFSGGYQALNRLVNRLDTLVTISHRHLRASGPLVGISAVTVTPQQSSSGSGSKSALSVALTATIYQRSASSAAGTTEATG